MEGVAPHKRRRRRSARDLGFALAHLHGVPKITGLAVVVAGLLGSYLIVYLIGGAGRVAPHFFYLPILFAGVRFGPAGGAATAIVSAALAGPAMPLDVEQGTPQHMSEWVSTGGFFLDDVPLPPPYDS